MDPRELADEQILIDYVMGRCEADRAEDLRRRLEQDEELRQAHDSLVNTFAAMDRLPEHEPPEDLVSQTMQRIRRQKRTDALVARERKHGPVVSPTFSMREMGGVAAAAVLIAAVVIPSVIEAGRRTDRVRCASSVGSLGAAIQSSANDHGGLLPGAPLPDGASGAGASESSDEPRWLPAGDARAVSNSSALFSLVRGQYASPADFQCPAVGGGSFVVRAGMMDFPAAKHISYSYQYAIGPWRLRQDDDRLAAVAEQMAILADGTPLFEGGQFHRDRLDARASENHDGRGQNVLYFDMHVDWAERPTAGVSEDNIFLAGQIRDYRGVERPTSLHDTFLLPTFTPDR